MKKPQLILLTSFIFVSYWFTNKHYIISQKPVLIRAQCPTNEALILIYIIKGGLSDQFVCLCVCIPLAPTVLAQSAWHLAWTLLRPLQNVSNNPCLGILLFSDLKLKDHINKILKKQFDATSPPKHLQILSSELQANGILVLPPICPWIWRRTLGPLSWRFGAGFTNKQLHTRSIQRSISIGSEPVC